jgi:hypothetical protein
MERTSAIPSKCANQEILVVKTVTMNSIVTKAHPNSNATRFLSAIQFNIASKFLNKNVTMKTCQASAGSTILRQLRRRISHLNRHTIRPHSHLNHRTILRLRQMNLRTFRHNHRIILPTIHQLRLWTQELLTFQRKWDLRQ